MSERDFFMDTDPYQSEEGQGAKLTDSNPEPAHTYAPLDDGEDARIVRLTAKTDKTQDKPVNARYVKHITPKQYVDEGWADKKGYAVFSIVSAASDPQIPVTESMMQGRITGVLIAVDGIGIERNNNGFFRRAKVYVNQPELAVYEIADYALFEVVTAAEAQKEYGLAEPTVRQAINRGTIPARKSGETWLVLRKDAEARWGKGLTTVKPK